MAGTLGATYTPHCAVLQPARLARGLAAGRRAPRGGALRGLPGARPSSRAPPTVRPLVRTPGGDVRADVVVRAIEGWTPQLPGERRRLAPVYSLMVATEPLPASFWSSVGLGRPRDLRRPPAPDHLRAAHRRRPPGLRGAGRPVPLRLVGATVLRPRPPRAPVARRHLAASCSPSWTAARITHAWGGPLGVPRDWYSSVGYDPLTGVAWAGGYVGDGVSTTNLAGRTLADLILRRDTDLVRLPWVGHRSPPWEPEPLRWLGVNAGLWTMDRGRPGRATARPALVAGRPHGAPARRLTPAGPAVVATLQVVPPRRPLSRRQLLQAAGLAGFGAATAGLATASQGSGAVERRRHRGRRAWDRVAASSRRAAGPTPTSPRGSTPCPRSSTSSC